MKMEIIGPFLLTLLAGFSTMIGCLLTFIKTVRVGEVVVLFLTFSMGIMISLSIFDLIPNSIPFILNKYGLYYGIAISILIFMLGYLTIDIINRFIKLKDNNLYRIGILSMISLMIHNFPEGILVFMSAYSNFKLGIKLCISIMLHNIPEGISISIPIYYSGQSRGMAIKMTLLSSIAEPLGALLSFLFIRRGVSISFIMLFVSGLMISLSLNDILKEILHYNNIKNMIIGFIVSISLSLLLFS